MSRPCPARRWWPNTLLRSDLPDTRTGRYLGNQLRGRVTSGEEGGLALYVTLEEAREDALIATEGNAERINLTMTAIVRRSGGGGNHCATPLRGRRAITGHRRAPIRKPRPACAILRLTALPRTFNSCWLIWRQYGPPDEAGRRQGEAFIDAFPPKQMPALVLVYGPDQGGVRISGSACAPPFWAPSPTCCSHRPERYGSRGGRLADEAAAFRCLVTKNWFWCAVAGDRWRAPPAIIWLPRQKPHWSSLRRGFAPVGGLRKLVEAHADAMACLL